jgi:hypothetical protein
MVLANAAKEKSVKGGRGTAHQCWLSQKTIAERVEYSVPSVQRALRTLNVKGLALSKFGADHRGYRIFSEFYLNINGEPIESFAERCGITWRAKPLKHQNEGKDRGRLNINETPPTHQPDAASTFNRENNRERARAKRRLVELPADWRLPDDWRRTLLTEFDATDQQLEKLAKRFHNHYRNLAKLRDRRTENWFAKLRQWCLRDLSLRSPDSSSSELSEDAWAAQVKFWLESRFWHPGIGAAPNEIGCRVPHSVLAKFGLGPAHEAA